MSTGEPINLSSGEVMWRLQRAIDHATDETRPGLLEAYSVLGGIIIKHIKATPMPGVDDEPDFSIGRVPTIRRGLGLDGVGSFCQVRETVGSWAGFACCEPLAHEGKHAIRLQARPEERAHEWSTPSSSPDEGRRTEAVKGAIATLAGALERLDADEAMSNPVLVERSRDDVDEALCGLRNAFAIWGPT